MDGGPPGSGDGGRRLAGFEEYVEARILANVVRTFLLTPEQAALVLKLTQELRLFFEGTVAVGDRGLDAPIEGDLYYHCSFDYDVQVPDWAAWRAT